LLLLISHLANHPVEDGFDLGGENSLHFAETAVGVEHLLDAHAVARPLLDPIKIALVGVLRVIRLLVRPMVGHR
jgi:hypothetical protein